MEHFMSPQKWGRGLDQNWRACPPSPAYDHHCVLFAEDVQVRRKIRFVGLYFYIMQKWQLAYAYVKNTHFKSN